MIFCVLFDLCQNYGLCILKDWTEGQVPEKINKIMLNTNAFIFNIYLLESLFSPVLFPYTTYLRLLMEKLLVLELSMERKENERRKKRKTVKRKWWKIIALISFMEHIDPGTMCTAYSQH